MPNQKDTVEIIGLITEIKREAANLRTLFLSQEEQDGIKSVLASFDRCMAENVYCTLKNMEAYRLYGWRELCGSGGEASDEPYAGDGAETGGGKQTGIGE